MHQAGSASFNVWDEETTDIGRGIANTSLPAVTCKGNLSQRRHRQGVRGQACCSTLLHTRYSSTRSSRAEFSKTAILAHLRERFLREIDLRPLKKVLASKIYALFVSRGGDTDITATATR